MEEDGPSKSELETAFKKLRSLSANKVCFDCASKNPTWATVTYGVFICIDCSAVHRSLGVHLTFVKSTQLDTNWSWIQLKSMQLGGNSNAAKFFQQHNCLSTDAQQKYNSRAAQLYREKLSQMSQKSIRTHGKTIHLDSVSEPEGNAVKEVDFFEEHSNQAVSVPDENFMMRNASMARNGKVQNKEEGPNVKAALSNDSNSSKSRKPTIGQRRPASKLGAKKLGGLGAQRVKTDFSAIEKEAARSESMLQEKKPEPSKVQQSQSLATLEETYQKMSISSKKEEERMKKIDPKKAAQAERLGMALGKKTGISHSLFEDMKTIEQEKPLSKSSSHESKSYRDLEIDEEYDTILRFSHGPPKYRDSPFEGLTKTSGIDDLLGSNVTQTNTNFDDDFEKLEKPSSSMLSKSSSKGASSNYKYTPIEETGAQQKFGNAKGISSDMYFGGSSGSGDNQTSVSRFEGSTSISSDQYFGNTPRSTGGSMQAPDLDDVRESVKQGVTKVAGRLSNMANNMMSSIQDRYS